MDKGKSYRYESKFQFGGDDGLKNHSTPSSSQKDLKKERLSPEELHERDRKLIEKVCSDEDFAYYFIHELCRPLLSKIVWTIYNNDADYDELVNTLYIHLKKPDADGNYWHALNSFDYRTSLFDYIKTIAVRLFYTPSDEVFAFPEHMVENGMAEEMFSHVGVALFRKYLWFRYVGKLEADELALKLGVEREKLSSVSRRAIKHFKKVVNNDFPDYYNELFRSDSTQTVDIDTANNVAVSTGNQHTNETHIDALAYLDRMPNERYRIVIRSLFLEDKDSEEVAEILNTPVSNVYNMKLRAIEQLRDIALHFRDVSGIEYYIKKVPDDRYRDLLLSIFVKKEDYDTIRSRYVLTETDFKKMKKGALRELKSLIFKK